MSQEAGVIRVTGACEHNLRDLDLTIERQKITVITGVSGSGKSSLAFDTILADAQRRFFYTLSHYSRQFLDIGTRPAVRKIEGLSPAIALAQNETQPSMKATVGTLTDVAELIGVMLARFGDQYCPTHDRPTTTASTQELVSRILSEFDGETVAVCIPVAAQKKGVFRTQLNHFAKKGYLRAYIDGTIVPLSPAPELEREEKHSIKIIVDTIKVSADRDRSSSRLNRSMEMALEDGDGFAEYFQVNKAKTLDLTLGGSLSSTGGCPVCGFSWPKLDARYFSANSIGKCKPCKGLGHKIDEAEEVNEAELARTAGLAICKSCDGTGLDSKYNGIRIEGYHAQALHLLSIQQLLVLLKKWLNEKKFNPAFLRVAEEVSASLMRLDQIGLGYLHLARRIRGISSGESQRLKLAGILSENLRGILYVLDEPSQGLHPSELDRLWGSLERLKLAGNTILIVDHDESLMRKADWIVDLGPGGGAQGGRLIANFAPKDAPKYAEVSATARSLSIPRGPSSTKGLLPPGRIQIKKAHANNLRDVEVSFPIGGMTVVAGVSGAGKSSLVLQTIYPNLKNIAQSKRKKKKPELVNCEAFIGGEGCETISLVDRKPIAKSSISMPASYLDIFTDIRNLYATLPEAQVAGLTARSFSLSVEGGRCPECKGRGEVALTMKFLADARVRCVVCHGQRFRPHVLDVAYGGLNLHQLLNLSLQEAHDHFKHHRKIARRLAPALELGLGYLKLGQPSASLSGGEAQRLKLAPFFSKQHGAEHFLIMDEPTTGLHTQDAALLVEVLGKLRDLGTTIIMIEHSSDMIQAADWLIDLGPGSADGGGRVLYSGPPGGILGVEESITARYLH